MEVAHHQAISSGMPIPRLSMAAMVYSTPSQKNNKDWCYGTTRELFGVTACRTFVVCNIDSHVLRLLIVLDCVIPFYLISGPTFD